MDDRYISRVTIGNNSRTASPSVSWCNYSTTIASNSFLALSIQSFTADNRFAPSALLLHPSSP